MPGLADSKVAEARRRHPHSVDEGRWPDAGAVVRLLALVFGAIAILGWMLTALDG